MKPMSLVELPGPSFFNLDCIAVAGYHPARMNNGKPQQTKMQILPTGGASLTIEGLGAQILFAALKRCALPIAAEEPKA